MRGTSVSDMLHIGSESNTFQRPCFQCRLDTVSGLGPSRADGAPLEPPKASSGKRNVLSPSPVLQSIKVGIWGSVGLSFPCMVRVKPQPKTVWVHFQLGVWGVSFPCFLCSAVTSQWGLISVISRIQWWSLTQSQLEVGAVVPCTSCNVALQTWFIQLIGNVFVVLDILQWIAKTNLLFRALVSHFRRCSEMVTGC